MSTDVNEDTSESVAVCEAWDDSPDPEPEVPVPSLSLSHELASPHTPRALFAHTISASDALSHFMAKAKHMFLVTMTRLFLRATIHDKAFVPSRGTLSFCLILHGSYEKLKRVYRIQGTWSALDARNLKCTAMHQ